MVQFCQLGMLGNVWGIDGRGSVDENIKKARQAFFNCGSIGAFQGDLNPLSSRSILDACVMPILLYGFEKLVDDTCIDGEGGIFPGRIG